MTRSEATARPGGIIDEIVGLLDEDRMRREIDDRIDWVRTRFRWERDRPFSARFFHQVVGGFVGCVYEHGLRLARRLSPLRARAEALSLIERHYRGKHHYGYDAALFDAADPQHNGVDVVLFHMAEAIKANERQSYVKWVFATRLGTCDWATRVEVVRAILDRHRSSGTPEFQSCVPAQLVDLIPDMILNEVATTHQLHQMLGSPSVAATC